MTPDKPTDKSTDAQVALHTPLPWTWTPCETEGPLGGDEPISGAQLVQPNGKSVFTIECGDYQGLSNADAAFIVRAVNAHDDLLAACKLAISPFVQDVSEQERRRDVCRAAIAKAEGR